MRYQMGAAAAAGVGGGALTIKDFVAMQAANDEERRAKRNQMLTLGLGLLAFTQAQAQQPVEDKRSSIDAPAIDAIAADIEDFDFTSVDQPTMEKFAALVAKQGHQTATSLQRGVDNNGKQGILGGGGNNTNTLLLLGAAYLLSD